MAEKECGGTLEASGAVQDVTYTPFHQADLIKEKFKNGTNTWLAQIKLEYGDDYERRYAEFSDTKSSGSVTQKKYELYYADNFEELFDASINQTTKINYIYGSDGLCAMVVDKGAGPEIFSVYKDYLGSILTVINKNGTKKYEQSFDAWGRRRGANDWKYSDWKSNTLIDPSVLPTWLHRGYTGHEHYDGLSEIVLINMNARLYDPVNGRMLRWDIALGVAGTQGYNRYSYANNNPLKFIDPTGNLGHIAIGAIVGSVANVVNGVWTGQIRDGWDLLAYAGSGAAIGALAAATGGASLAASGLSAATVGGGMVAGFTSGAVGGSLQAGANSTYQLLKYKKGSWNGVAESMVEGGVIGGIGGAIIGGIGGGIAKWLKGRNLPPSSNPRQEITFPKGKKTIVEFPKLISEGVDGLAEDGTEAFIKGFGEPGRVLALGSDEAISGNLNGSNRINGWYDVIIHGTADGKNFSVDGKIISASDLYKKMLENGYEQGMRIRLMSCYSGSQAQGVAYQLSKLANAQVIAPTHETWFMFNQWMVTGGYHFNLFKP